MVPRFDFGDVDIMADKNENLNIKEPVYSLKTSDPWADSSAGMNA